jgi:hypothetical protein
MRRPPDDLQNAGRDADRADKITGARHNMGMAGMPSEVTATYFGIRIRTWDPLTYAEQEQWLQDLTALVPTLDPFYGQLVDLRDLRGICASDPALIEEGMNLVLACGLKRSAVIVSDPVTAMEVKRMAWETGVHEWERYLDASSEPDWERLALDWIDHAIDPYS